MPVTLAHSFALGMLLYLKSVATHTHASPFRIIGLEHRFLLEKSILSEGV